MFNYIYNGSASGTKNGAGQYTATSLVSANLRLAGYTVNHCAITSAGNGQYLVVIGVLANNAIEGLQAVNAALDDFFDNRDIVYTGTSSTTPTTTTSTSNTSTTAPYTVVSGDTLSKIASKTGVSVANLIAFNKARYPSLATNPNLINVGWVFSLNGNTVTNTPVITGAQVAPILNQNQQNTGQYIPTVTGNPNVTPSPPKPNTDSLEAFAKKLGISVSVLAILGVVIVVVATKK